MFDFEYKRAYNDAINDVLYECSVNKGNLVECIKALKR